MAIAEPDDQAFADRRRRRAIDALALARPGGGYMSPKDWQSKPECASQMLKIVMYVRLPCDSRRA